MVLWLAAVGLAAGLAFAPVRAAAGDTVSLSATRTLTLLPPSAFGSDDPGDGWVLDGHHGDDGLWTGVARAQVTKFIANAGKCAPSGYVSLQVVSPPRASYSLGLVFASKNGDALLAQPIALDAAASADISSVAADAHGALPQFLVVLGGSGQAPASVDVKLTWTGVADPACTGVSAPPPTLKVIKHVVGGSASAAQWSLHVQSAAGAEVAGSPQAGSETGTTYSLSDGTFTVSETGGLSGYVGTFSGDCDSTGKVTLAAGDQKTCTLTNTASPPPAALTVIKHVVGGSASAGRWSLHVQDASGTEVAGSPQPGSESGTTYTLPAGTFTLSETGDLSGYTGAFSGDCDATGTVALQAGDRKTCTLTNTASAPANGTLTVIKQVSGGSAVPADWQIHVVRDGVDVADSPQPGSATGTTYTLAPGTVMVAESGGPGVYAPTYSGDCNASGGVTIVAGAAETCTLTNTFLDTTPPVLHGPGDLTATASSPAGAVVSYDVTATDPDDPVVIPDCVSSPSGLSSGSAFPIGVTQIECRASDAARNVASPLDFTVTVVDAPPALSLPGDVRETTNDPLGKAEAFVVSATDFADGSVAVVCDRASGDVFPVGTTTVHCHATNSSGQTSDGSFTVTIAYVDVTSPTIHGPGDVTTTATSPDGAAVSFDVSASDPDDASAALVVGCDHGSGQTFAIGVATVTCRAHDPAGNEAQAVTFTVTVHDATPALSLPGEVRETTNDPLGKVAAFAVSATDFEDGSIAVVCDRASGDVFPVGTTTVDCHATNSSGQTTDGSFTVTIAYVDVTSPTIHGPGDVTTTATSPDGAAVSFDVSASDPDDASAALVVGCDHSSGQTFAIGVTTVTCQAHDPAGNEAQPESFSVTVNDAAPKLSLPNGIHDVGHDPHGKVETFAASATDFEDGSVAVACDHASGALFAVATTTVHCHATNSSGRTTDGAFTVRVDYVDTTAPVVHVSGDQHVTATSTAGAAVVYTATADDPDDGAGTLAVACGPVQSGATFPVGVSTVTCTASDPAGNHAAPSSFTVTVDPPLPAPPATVSVSVSAPALGRVGEDITFSVVVRSASGAPSTGIAVHAQVPDGVALVSTSGAATCTGQTDVVCQFGSLAAGATATQTIVLRPQQAGSLSLFATVSGDGAAGSSSASTTVLDPGTAPPAPPTPPQPRTFNAISTGTVLVNGVEQPSDTLFLVVSGDQLELKGLLSITTSAGNSGLFSNAPFSTGARRTSAVAATEGEPASFTVRTTGAGTTMTLDGGDFAQCTARRLLSANKPKTVVRQLWGRAKGTFTTKARYSSATIRGTTWGVEDRCDGSFTTAVDDFVDVVDFGAKTKLTLAPGDTYLATPPRNPAGVFRPPLVKLTQQVRSHGLLWGGRRFRTKAQLAAWLVTKGSSWHAFAAKHPALAKALASR